MSINTHNYEAFLMDYYEGNLDAEHVAELLLFMEENPDLAADMDVLAEPVVFEMENRPQYPNKNELMLFGNLPDLNAETEELYFHQAVEKELNTAQLIQLNHYLNEYPDKRRDLDLYHKSQLIPDLTIEYRSKKELYQSKVISWQAYSRYAGIAASVLFLMLISNWWNTNENPNVESIAKSEIPGKAIPKITQHAATGILHPLMGVKHYEADGTLEKKVQSGVRIEERAIAIRKEKVIAPNSNERIQEVQPLPKGLDIQEVIEKDLSIAEVNINEVQTENNQEVASALEPKLKKSTPKLNQFLLNKLGGKFNPADKNEESADYKANEVALAIAENMMPGVELQQDDKGVIKTLSFKLGKFSVTRKTGRN